MARPRKAGPSTSSEGHDKVVLPFTPRAWQRPLIADPAKRIVAVVHRRAGKSTALLWRGIKRCLTEQRSLPRVVHILPYSVMWGRTGLWDQLAEAARNIPGAEIRKGAQAVIFPNGSTFQCGGADNQDSWRGSYADECILDEFDDHPPSMVPLVIEPMLADRDGTLVRSGTPKGNGVLQAAYERAKTTAGYSTYLLDYRKTNALSDMAIDRLRQEMSEAEFQQELCCSFEAPNSGSYYGRLLQEADDEGRITHVPHEPTLRVWTAWDLGIHDATSIWFAQILRTGEWRIIDYIEGSGEALDYYSHMLQMRGYHYERHILPHDAAIRELGSGKSRTETLYGLGLKPSRVIRQHSVADGINAVRLVLPRCYFDTERCKQGLRSLRNYRREWNESAQTWRSQPVHDHASHAADAFRYLCLGVREENKPLAEPAWNEARGLATGPALASARWMEA